MVKKHMTKQEEFEIMKLVLDKFLWLGILIIALGLYRILSSSSDFWLNFSILVSGAVVLILFVIILVKEYEFIKH